jgi:hypothetical protein
VNEDIVHDCFLSSAKERLFVGFNEKRRTSSVAGVEHNRFWLGTTVKTENCESLRNQNRL